MIRSFLNTFLPEDEYKRLKILYVMAETAFLTVLALLLFGFFKYYLNFNLSTELILLLGPFFMGGIQLSVIFYQELNTQRSQAGKIIKENVKLFTNLPL